MRYGKLCGRIVELYGTQKNFAAAMRLNVCTLSLKLRGRAEWTSQEIAVACNLLGIPLEEMHTYFFSREVGKTQRDE